jgi:shikimate dehydrogenase
MSSVTRIGLIGTGIQHPATPALHRREAAADGFDCTYQLIDLDVLGGDATALPGLLSDAAATGIDLRLTTFPC